MSQIQQALEALKTNQNYQVLVNELKSLQSNVENLIFDESTDEKSLKALIIKRNTIKNFIELPDDVINIEKLKDFNKIDSATDSNES
jgi:hypothetical protein